MRYAPLVTTRSPGLTPSRTCTKPLLRTPSFTGRRTKVSPLVAAGHTLFGPLNQYIHIWAYKDGGERDRLRAEASKTVEGWPPATREFLVKQENMLMIPAACSPLH